MIYTTNWIERFNKSEKRTTKIRNSFSSPESAIALVGSVVMDLDENHYNYLFKIFANDKKILNFQIVRSFLRYTKLNGSNFKPF